MFTARFRAERGGRSALRRGRTRCYRPRCSRNATVSPFTGATVTRNAGTGYFYANPAAAGRLRPLSVQRGYGRDERHRQIDLADRGNGLGSRPGLRPARRRKSSCTARRAGEPDMLPSRPWIHRYAPAAFDRVTLIGGRTRRGGYQPRCSHARRPTTSPLVDSTLQDFTVTDLDNDGTADIVVSDRRRRWNS